MSRALKSFLIVEDDAFKLERIRRCLDRLDDCLSIDVANSVQAAVSRVGQDTYDYILLDMSLPAHDLKPGGLAGTSLLSGGLEVIMELSFLSRGDRVIVITQYPEVEIEGELVPISSVKNVLSAMFGANVDAVIHYKQDATIWESELLETLERQA